MRRCDTLFSTPAPAQDAWQRERMEYAFSVAARVSDDAFGERTLSAAEYFEGRLDWHAFDLNGEVALGAAGDPPGERPVSEVSAGRGNSASTQNSGHQKQKPHLRLADLLFPRFGMVADRFGVSWMVYVAP